MKPVRWIISFIVVGIFICALGLFATFPTNAQSPHPTPISQFNPYIVPQTNPNVPTNLHTWTQEVTIELLSSIGCELGGYDLITHSDQCLGIDTSTGKIGYVPSRGGLLSLTGNMIGDLYSPPIHTADYVRYLSSNFGLVKPVDAQGTGFPSLTPLVKLWVTFRNIVYMLFILIFVIVGFAIMLRVRIDPRTVMTIQNQLPKLVIGLLLVTFSFAIAGFLIDLMWVSVYIIINILTSPAIDAWNPTNGNLSATSNLFQNPFGFANNVMPGGFLGIAAGAGGNIGGTINALFRGHNSDLLSMPSTNCVGFDIGCWIGSNMANVLGGIVGGLVVIITTLLGIIIVLIALIIAMFRLWFSLLMAYVFILLDIIFAPFYIAIGLLPGSKVGFTSWLRRMCGNLAAFPVAIALFLIGRVFIDGLANGGNIFVPPLIGNPGGTGSLGFLIGVGIFLLVPNAVSIARGMFAVQPGKTSAFILGGIGAGGAAVTGTARGALGTAGAAMFNISGQRDPGSASFGRVFTRLFR